MAQPSNAAREGSSTVTNQQTTDQAGGHIDTLPAEAWRHIASCLAGNWIDKQQELQRLLNAHTRDTTGYRHLHFRVGEVIAYIHQWHRDLRQVLLDYDYRISPHGIRGLQHAVHTYAQECGARWDSESDFEDINHVIRRSLQDHVTQADIRDM